MSGIPVMQYHAQNGNVRYRWQPIMAYLLEFSFKFWSPAHHAVHLIPVPRGNEHKILLCHIPKVYKWNGGAESHIINLIARCRWVVLFTLPQSTPKESLLSSHKKRVWVCSRATGAEVNVLALQVPKIWPSSQKLSCFTYLSAGDRGQRSCPSQ